MATGVGYLNRSLPVFSSKEHNRNPTSVDFPSTDCKRKSDNSTEVKHWKRWPTKKCLTYRRSKNIKAINRVKQLLFSETERSIA